MDGWIDNGWIMKEWIESLKSVFFLMSAKTNRQRRTITLVYYHFYSLFYFFHLSFLPTSPSLPSLIHLQLQVLREGHGTHGVMTIWLCCTDGKSYGMANDRPWLGSCGGRYSKCPQFWVISRKNIFLSLSFVYLMWLLVHPPQKIKIPHYISYISDSFNHHIW